MIDMLSKTQTKLRIDALKAELEEEDVNWSSVEDQWRNIRPTFLALQIGG